MSFRGFSNLLGDPRFRRLLASRWTAPLALAALLVATAFGVWFGPLLASEHATATRVFQTVSGLVFSAMVFVVLRSARASESNFRSMFDALDVMLFVLDEQGRVIHVNQAVLSRLGYERAELLGRPVLDVHPPERRDEAARIVGEMLAGKVASCPVPVQRKDGRLIPVETRVVHGEWNGQPALLGMTHDISALKRSEEQFSKVFQAAPSLMALSSLDDGTYLEVNEAFVAGTGYSRQETIGHSSSELGLFESPAERARALEKLSREGRLRDFPVRVRHRSGAVLDGLFSAELIRLQDRDIALTMMLDVTERLRGEHDLEAARAQAEAANRAKSAFLAMMSHEIRTPLNGVLGMAEVLERSVSEPAQREGLAVIHGAGEQLLGVLNDVLDFSKIEAGQVELNVAPFSPADAVREVAELLRPRAAHVAFTTESAPAFPMVLGDGVRFRQVLTNLVGNALKFTEKGTVHIALSRLTAPEGRCRLRAAVRDSGLGISPEGRERLFKVFSQADGGRRFGGTGLGLAISKRLVELQGGVISVESEAGRGSTFAFELEFPVCAPALAHAPVAVEQPSRLSGRVLMAEDNVVNQAVARRMLSLLGVEVVMVPDGRAAVERYLDGDIDLVLMDMEMPELDGPAATQAIRALQGAHQVPIIALTANVLPGDRQRCLDAGMNDFLGKPYRLDVLRGVLQRWLPRAELQRAG